MRVAIHSAIPAWGVSIGITVSVVALLLGSLSVVVSVTTPIVVVVGLALSFQIIVYRYTFSLARREGGPQPFTVATLVTVLRGTTLIVLAGFVVMEPPSGALGWLPALLFGAGALFDWVDGAVARATNSVSAFGARLDIETDALALLIGSIVAVSVSVAPIFYLAVGLARYVFVGGIALREFRSEPVFDLPDRQSRRILGAMQMFVVFLLLAPMPGQTLSWWLAVVALVPFLLGFVRDWLLVTGAVR